VKKLIFLALFFSTILSGRTIKLTLNFPQPELKKKGRYYIVKIKGCYNFGNPGKPVLPLKTLNILIPPDEVVRKVEVLPEDKIIIEGKYTVIPGEKPVPLSRPEYSNLSFCKKIYNSERPYPYKNFSISKIQKFRGYRILPVNIYPVKFIPSKKKIFYYKKIKVIVETERKKQRKIPVLYRALEKDRFLLLKKIDNPDIVKTYTKIKLKPLKTGILNGGPYDYIIITNQDLENSFQPLINHKIKRGLKARIVTVEWIESNYEGNDLQEKIRNFIIDAYETWKIDYVLLGGDTEIIPYRGVYCRCGDYEDYDIPCDMYYGCLDGNWDGDGDGIYGEEEDDVDMFAEVYVGRAPVETEKEVENFINKVIWYENNFKVPYHKKFLLIGEKIYENPEIWGGDYKDRIESIIPKSYQITKYYDRDGTFNGNGQLIIDAINNGVHFINHMGHSNYWTVAHIGDCEFYDISGDPYDIKNENNFCFFYSQGCYAGAFDKGGSPGATDECVGENFVRSKYGAFAVIMNSRYGWFYVGDIENSPSQRFDKEFWNAVFNEGIKSIGIANQYSKEENFSFVNEDETGAYRWCYYELNLLGDPETNLGGSVSREGRIFFDKGKYKNGDEIKLTVMDMDLNTDHENIDTFSIQVTTSGGDSENIELEETGKNTGVFEGKITLKEKSFKKNNGIVECEDGELIIATYIDEDDGNGNCFEREAKAYADFTPPLISDIEVVDSLADRATIIWKTDEPAESKVYYGDSSPPQLELEDRTLTTSHLITLKGLNPETFYYFAVQSKDEAGNVSYMDNSGNFYSFVTAILHLIFSDGMEEGEGNWEVSYQAQGEPQHNWYITENFSYNGEHCWHFCDEYGNGVWHFTYNPGVAPFDGFLTSPPIDLNSYQNARLNFFSYFWIGGSQNTWDFGKVEISKDDGQTWENLWEAQDTGGKWEEVDIDLTQYCGNTVKLRFHFHCEFSDTRMPDIYPGWFIDDIKVTSSEPSDTDRDNLPDNWEIKYFGNLNYGKYDDPDNDGLSNLDEYNLSTDPTDSDTDRDGLPDGWEADYNLDPTDPTGENGPEGDPDNDGYTNLEEYIGGSNPVDGNSTPNTPPSKPENISPQNGEENVELDPRLEASEFSYSDQSDTQTASEWQIFYSDQSEDETPVYHQIITLTDISLNPSLKFNQIDIPWGTLKPSEQYKWRVRYRDNYPEWSEWSDFTYFKTVEKDPDLEKQIPDETSLAELEDLYQVDTGIKGLNGKTVGLKVDRGEISMVKNIDHSDLPDEGKPSNLPLGLFSTRIEGLTEGETVILRFYIPGNYVDSSWYKYDPVVGWYEYDAVFNYDSDGGYTEVEIILQDGGNGDLDGVKNGVIVDPSGPAKQPSPSGGGGGGCFIATAAYGSSLSKQVIILKEFRDRYLLKNRIGKAFVRFYYTHSPKLAEFIERHTWAKYTTRIILYPVVFLCFLIIKGLIIPVVTILISSFILYRLK